MSIDLTHRVVDDGQDSSPKREGLKHLQAGRWEEAIRCLELAAGQHPYDAEVQDALAEARYKVEFDATVAVRPLRWALAWRKHLIRALVIVLIAAAAVAALQIFQTRVAPSVEAAQTAQQAAAAVRDGKRYLEAGKLVEARAAFSKTLALQPGDEAATAGLQQIDHAEMLEKLYAEGVTAQRAGDVQLALEQYNAILQRSSGYKDVVARIREIRQRMDEDALFARAEESYKENRCPDALEGYRQLQALNTGYKRDLVVSRTFDCNMRLGQEIIQSQSPTADRLLQAKAYFKQALGLRPRDPSATTEERLLTVYLAGQAAVEVSRWDEVARLFETIHKQRPGYLGSAYLRPLYDAYIANGDAHAAAERYADAWDQYDKAVGLPVENSVVAAERRYKMGFRITPTPTPTMTPTGTPVPTATAYVYTPPTGTPSPTPPPPLASFRNQIVFRADKEGQYGYWVMNPDGSNRRYLGASKELDTQYAALIERETVAPDGKCRLYPYREQGDKFVQIYIRCPGNRTGELWSRKLTAMDGMCYDAVWAPDGSRIAFVGTEKGSDDVYVINPDGTSWWNYTPNDWEWDKHPSFSPDSRRIVFWSNREGIKQIYVIDADGRNLKKIKDTTWDEYDPIWVK